MRDDAVMNHAACLVEISGPKQCHKAHSKQGSGNLMRWRGISWNGTFLGRFLYTTLLFALVSFLVAELSVHKNLDFESSHHERDTTTIDGVRRH